MGPWIGIVIGALAVVALAVVLVLRHRRSTIDTAPDVELPARPARPDPAPMTDLESALARVTDRSGRPIGEKIDAEAPIVDELRDADDTGPLLGKALDAIDRSTTRTGTDATADDDDPSGPAS